MKLLCGSNILLNNFYRVSTNFIVSGCKCAAIPENVAHYVVPGKILQLFGGTNFVHCQHNLHQHGNRLCYCCKENFCCYCSPKLFLCHQMAMEREAQIKQKNKQSASPTVAVAPPFNSQKTNAPIIWVLGGPGCGKGTQCDKIVAKYKFSHYSTGDLLRAEVASGSTKGKELAAIMQSGALVPNEAVLSLLQAAMANETKAVGFLVDGYPREKNQGVEFERSIAPVDLILYFDCDDSTLVARIMKRAAQSAVVRADDNEETLKTRIATFRRNTNEIIIQYPNKVKTINCERDIEVIFNDVVSCIDEMMEKKSLSPTAQSSKSSQSSQSSHKSPSRTSE